MLTDAGVHAVTVACRMPSPTLAADISPDKVLGDYNCWELVQALTRAKWQHQWVSRKEQPDPYEPHADSPKLVWYTRRQKEPCLRRFYMLALLKGEQQVPHFGELQDYRAICGIESTPKPSIKTVKIPNAAILNDDPFGEMLVPEGRKPPQKSKARAKKRVRSPSPLPILDLPDGEDEPIWFQPNAGGDASGNEGSGGESGSGAGGGGHGHGGGHDSGTEAGGGDGSAKSSSSSSSTSSTSSKSSTSRSPPRRAASKAGPKGSVEKPRVIGRQPAQKKQRTFQWGPFQIAPLHPEGNDAVCNGYGATCGCHRNHNDGKRVKCSKNLTDKSMSLPEMLIRVKMWLLMGSQVKRDDPLGRTKHKSLDFKTIELWDATMVEEMVSTLSAPAPPAPSTARSSKG